MHNDKKEKDGTWKDRSFASIMKEWTNWVLFGKHSVAAMNVSQTYLWRGLEKPDNVTKKALKACFKVIFKLYVNLNADIKLTIGEQGKTLLFFNSFSADHCNVFV